MNLKNKTDNNLKESKNSIFLIAFLLLVSPFIADVILYTNEGLKINTDIYYLILIIYYFSFILILYLGKFFTSIILIINFLFFCVFKEYFKHHDLPLHFKTLITNYKEGLVAGYKNIESLCDTSFFILLIILIIQIILVMKNNFLNIKKFFIVGSFFVLFLIIGKSFDSFELKGALQLHRHEFFTAYQKGLIYKLQWPLEYFYNDGTDELTNQIKTGNKAQINQMKKDDISLDFEPKHIYLIQGESLTTKSLEGMPFLKEKSKENSFIDKNHTRCLGSANTDFMMMTGNQLNCKNVNVIIYYSYTNGIYKNNQTLAHDLKNKDYETVFLHNYKSDFYNRKNHYKTMGFDKIIFEENFLSNVKRFEWGVDDFELMKKSANITQKNKKTFQFIITNGMHPPYKSKNNKYYTKDKTLNNYLNASNLLDEGLEFLYNNAPNDSLFIIYGDHSVKEINAFDTPVIFYYKGDKNFKIKNYKKEGFNETVYFINSLLR